MPAVKPNELFVNVTSGGRYSSGVCRSVFCAFPLNLASPKLEMIIRGSVTLSLAIVGITEYGGTSGLRGAPPFLVIWVLRGS